MKNLVHSFFFLAIVGFSVDVMAQEDHLNCGLNHYTESLHESHPERLKLVEQAEKELEEYTDFYELTKDAEDDVIIIPVVFHVVHTGGEENISVEQINSAIEVLNEDFNASNNDVDQVVEEFADIVGDVKFEFRLAKKDPNGNCTNGINRVFSETTNEGGFDMKEAAQSWGRESYLNIWVCRQIGSGAAGYAFLPPTVNGSWEADIDGIVILHSYVGRIGTSNATRSHALSHEVGHWANLRHTWGGSNTPALSTNCSDDDNVADTPATIGWQSCNLSGETCGSLDNVENFMDYSYCYKMFTEGQKNRMRASLNSSIAQRNQLHSQNNLVETGVLDEDIICQAAFNVDVEPVLCVGQEITFDDISFNGVENRSWAFEGGTPATSTEDSPVVSYDSPGFYDVTLTVSNPQSEETITMTDFIHVVDAPQYSLPFQEGFENIDEIGENQEWRDINQDNSNISWEITDQVAYSGSQCVYVQGRSNTDFQTEVLESPTFDLSGIEGNATFTFKYAHARRNFSSDDILRVYISRDCGESWNLRESRGIDELPTVSGNVSGQFIPDSQDDWEEVEIGSIFSIFLSSEFRVKFEFTSVDGNNIFIDDINIYDPSTLSVENSNLVKGITLFPNPATDQVRLRVEFEKNQNIRIDVIDAAGRILQTPVSGQFVEGEQSFDIDLDDALASGMYFIRLTGEEGVAVRKLLVR